MGDPTEAVPVQQLLVAGTVPPRRKAAAVMDLMAEEEVHVLLFEPATTLNTGNARTELTRDRLETI